MTTIKEKVLENEQVIDFVTQQIVDHWDDIARTSNQLYSGSWDKKTFQELGHSFAMSTLYNETRESSFAEKFKPTESPWWTKVTAHLPNIMSADLKDVIV